MKLLIIPKPVLDNKMAVTSYCFRFKRADANFADQPSRAFDDAVNSVCLTVLESVGLDGFTNGLPIFVPINKLTLLAGLERQCNTPPGKVIFLLDNSLPPEEPFISNIKKLKDLGFKFALENITDYEYLSPVIELCNFVFVSAGSNQYKEVITRLTSKHRNLTCVLSDVDDMDTFDEVKFSNIRLFEGKFYSVPITKGYNTIAPVKVNSIQLMNIIRDEDFEIEKVVKVVSQDPYLSISLLKFVNSPYLGISQRIKTIQHAVAMLGQKEVRKWVTTATTGMLASDKPDEITKLSLMRAKFAENLAPHFEMAIHSPSLFLMGLFSILDAVLEMPMKDALKMVSVSDKIYNALVSMDGDFGKVLNFIYTYETGDWNSVYRLIVLYNLDVSDVYNSYIEAVLWYKSIAAADIEEQQ